MQFHRNCKPCDFPFNFYIYIYVDNVCAYTNRNPGRIVRSYSGNDSCDTVLTLLTCPLKNLRVETVVDVVADDDGIVDVMLCIIIFFYYVFLLFLAGTMCVCVCVCWLSVRFANNGEYECVCAYCEAAHIRRRCEKSTRQMRCAYATQTQAQKHTPPVVEKRMQTQHIEQ